MTRRPCSLMPALLVMLPAAALAHTGHGEVSGLQSGLVHPTSGLDHMLAMLAVGLLGVQLGGRMIWAMPLAFMSVMLAGGALAMAGVGMPGVEAGILLSVVVLGALVGAGRPLPQALGLAVAALFAFFHGHAHGSEMPLAAGGLAYGLGFLLSTAALHAVGAGLGLGLSRAGTRAGLRFAGLAIALLGVGLTVV